MICCMWDFKLLQHPVMYYRNDDALVRLIVTSHLISVSHQSFTQMSWTQVKLTVVEKLQLQLIKVSNCQNKTWNKKKEHTGTKRFATDDYWVFNCAAWKTSPKHTTLHKLGDFCREHKLPFLHHALMSSESRRMERALQHQSWCQQSRLLDEIRRCQPISKSPPQSWGLGPERSAFALFLRRRLLNKSHILEP